MVVQEDVLPSPADIIISELQHTPLQLPAVDMTENAQDDLVTEWTGAVNARYGHVVEPVASTSYQTHRTEPLGESGPLDVFNRILSSSSSGPSVPAQLDVGNDDVDMPLRSYVNPDNQRVISEMRDGRRIAIGFFSICGFQRFGSLYKTTATLN